MLLFFFPLPGTTTPHFVNTGWHIAQGSPHSWPQISDLSVDVLSHMLAGVVREQ